MHYTSPYLTPWTRPCQTSAGWSSTTKPTQLQCTESATCRQCCNAQNLVSFSPVINTNFFNKLCMCTLMVVTEMDNSDQYPQNLKYLKWIFLFFIYIHNLLILKFVLWFVFLFLILEAFSGIFQSFYSNFDNNNYGVCWIFTFKTLAFINYLWWINMNWKYCLFLI